ncbi:MAG: hypothetical protein AB7E47_00565 [Desulfovibrionaceae bacterium]
MPQSPELAGGTGFTFEGRVAAIYLAALLQQGYAPGIGDRVVSRVALQQRDVGEPLDDVIVDFCSSQGEPARLSLQVKRSLTISSAATNTDFRDVIRDAWLTCMKPDFRKGVDRYGAAVGNIAKGKARDLQTLCELARASVRIEDFAARFLPQGNASATVRKVKDDIAALVEAAKGSPCSEHELFEFLAHFVLIQFDFLHEGQVDLAATLNSLRVCLASGDETQALALWDRLCILAQERAGRAAVFERPWLVRSLAPRFRLATAPSLRQDLARIQELARQWAADIEDDVGGTRLERPALMEKLESKLSSCRWTQLRGLPGSGKSVLLRRRLEIDLARGPVLFLKSGRLEGNGWSGFAAANGLSTASLVNLLVEIAATGTSTLYIDGIDRIEKQHRGIILDVIRAIFGNDLLDDWRIVISLRDTGIEPLRNWLGAEWGAAVLGILEVTPLGDEEAELLAAAKPQLRRLLFGSKAVREIVRRPFFAKILHQGVSAAAGDDAFSPQSEVELIENWWGRGGYGEECPNALAQRALIELGTARATHLGREIAFRDISPATTAVVDQFVTDGILQYVRRGHSLRFSHDIFFEWAFLHALMDAPDWLAAVKECGEPPAVARVVELLAQSEFHPEGAWARTLPRIAGAGMRSQWTRAWLLGPLGAPNFVASADIFDGVLKADGHHFLKRALVWFQAEKITPNSLILEGDFPAVAEYSPERRVLAADYHGWPSDWAAWSRFITFLLERVADIPVTLYPDIVTLFEVWQNAFRDAGTHISNVLLDQVAAWLQELLAWEEGRHSWKESSRWDPLGRGDEEFKKSLIQLILRSSRVRPDLAESLLRKVAESEVLRRTYFPEVISFSPILARTHPDLLVHFALQYFCQELPEARRMRLRQESSEAAAARERIRAKPAEARTEHENRALESPLSLSMFFEDNAQSWDDLAIDEYHSNYTPPSPLREPFHSLFSFAPAQALRLVAELSNHAMTAWHQLHGLARHGSGTPIPLDVAFPWGPQRFLGGASEYLWFRGGLGPAPVVCGYQALAAWAFEELDRGRQVDGLIQQIVAGNECIAALGVAVVIALHANVISDVTFCLATSQLLLHVDFQRMINDLHPSASLIGFGGRADANHIESIKKINERPGRGNDLRGLLTAFFLSGEYRERIRAAVLNFVDDLPFQFESHRADQRIQESLRTQAVEYADFVTIENYRAEKVVGNEGTLLITVECPTVDTPERVALAAKAEEQLRAGSLWAWGAEFFKTRQIGEQFSIRSAIDFAKSIIHENLFEDVAADEGMIGAVQGGVAAAAAIVFDCRDEAQEADLTWARSILERAMKAPEKQDTFGLSRSIIPWHHKIFVANGLAADIRHGTGTAATAHELLVLVAHPLHAVCLPALETCLSLWDVAPSLGWAALHLSLARCTVVIYQYEHRDSVEAQQRDAARQRARIEEAIAVYEHPAEWADLPLPPPACCPIPRPDRRVAFDDEAGGSCFLLERVAWDERYAAEVVGRLPVEAILLSPARTKLLEALSGHLAWTIATWTPDEEPGKATRRQPPKLFSWAAALGRALGRVAGFCPVAEVEERFLKPMCALEDKQCWMLVAPFVDLYTCVHVYDATEIAPDALVILLRCLDRFLEAQEFIPNLYRSGELYDAHMPSLLRSLMFVPFDMLAPSAKRYANGDWSDVSRTLPVVDRFVKSAGWASIVMQYFLELCERAKAFYPAELFADQVLHVLDDEGTALSGWHGSTNPARIAGLVQYFSDRETPMARELGQKFLRILDRLVDMGDRRSAALQLSDTFREVQA